MNKLSLVKDGLSPGRVISWYFKAMGPDFVRDLLQALLSAVVSADHPNPEFRIRIKLQGYGPVVNLMLNPRYTLIWKSCFNSKATFTVEVSL